MMFVFPPPHRKNEERNNYTQYYFFRFQCILVPLVITLNFSENTLAFLGGDKNTNVEEHGAKYFVASDSTRGSVSSWTWLDEGSELGELKNFTRLMINKKIRRLNWSTFFVQSYNQLQTRCVKKTDLFKVSVQQILLV